MSTVFQLFALFLACALPGPVRSAPTEITAERVPEGVAVKVDGKLFAKYWVKAGCKPVVWPIVGPTGKPVTRSFPMEDQPGEDQDHLHQRSLWFTHGNVDGIDFWSELPGHGTIEHREFTRVEGGPQATIATKNDWLGPDGRKHLEDERTLTFRADADARALDFDITLKANDRPVTFGDTKEGTFGIRMAAGLTVESRSHAKLGGEIVNSQGNRNEAAWGKRVEWVDYHGAIDGQKVGVAILSHPASFRYPTFWHVRPYGLFAANPFGQHDFVGGKSGGFTLAPGAKIRLLYRVYVHRGNEKTGRVAEQFRSYAGSTK